MKTGEADPPATCLWRQCARGRVRIWLTNDFRSGRPSGWASVLFLGLTVGYIQHSMDAPMPAHVCCDITYVENSELGFDYRDGPRTTPCLPELRVRIIDDVDSILIDEARTPLIISGARNRRFSSTMVSTA